MKRGLNKIIWIAVGIVSLLSSCAKETETGGSPVSGETAMVKIETRAIGGSDPDNEIISVRIITFGAGGFVTGNTFYGEGAITATGGTIVHTMKSGVQDFIFIANENKGAELAALQASAFTGNKKKSDLSAISLPASAFNQTDAIPMLTGVDNVTVLPDAQGIKVNGGNIQINNWVVEMKRLGVRIDMVLKSNVNLENQFKGVSFPNVANAVPLTGNYSGANNTVKTFTGAADPANFEPYTLTQADAAAGYVWGKKVVRIILPSHMFTDKTNTAKALKMEVILNGWSGNPSAAISYDEPSDNTLPSNTNFTGEGIIGPLLQLNLYPVDWTSQDADGNIGRTLNVSAVKKYIIDGATERIYFNSNQKDVNIETNVMKWDPSSSTNIAFSTNSIFNSIADIGASNFHYDYDAVTSTGTGYVDLTDLGTAKGGMYKIYLNAGGLRREIKVAVMRTVITPIDYWVNSFHPYVGTFHRWNETDERRIKMPATGSVPSAFRGDWVAVVWNDEGKKWIKLDTEAAGANSGQVSSSTIVDGTATSGSPIWFRVGLTGNLPGGSAEASPRYGVIYVYYGNDLSKVHPIYVRQGEAADYLMRNLTEDNPKSGAMAGVKRTLATKISPYNLTDPNGGSGRVGAATGYKYGFTAYPSQGGYYFRWYQTWAWSPVGMDAVNWIFGNYSTAMWNIDWESCPTGYHRPSDGSTTANVSSVLAAASEWRQSLWLNPDNGITAANSANSTGGFLADGYFDRGTITSPEGDGAMSNTAVGAGTANAAYNGRLIYNPNTNASIFFPTAGYRDADTGKVTGLGSGAYYMSSTSNTSTTCWAMNHNMSQTTPRKDYGFSVRCIRD